MSEFNNRLRLAKADMQSIEELHDQRLKREFSKGAEADKRVFSLC